LFLINTMKLNISDKLLDDIEVIVQYQNSLLIHMIAAEYKDKCDAKTLIKKFIKR